MVLVSSRMEGLLHPAVEFGDMTSCFAWELHMRQPEVELAKICVVWPLGWP